jgi:hypothetical protein
MILICSFSMFSDSEKRTWMSCYMTFWVALFQIETDRLFSNIIDIIGANCQLWEECMLPVVEEGRRTRQPLSTSGLKEGFLKVSSNIDGLLLDFTPPPITKIIDLPLGPCSPPHRIT